MINLEITTPRDPEAVRVTYKVFRGPGGGVKVKPGILTVALGPGEVGQGFIDYEEYGSEYGAPRMMRPVSSAYEQDDSVKLHPLRVEQVAIDKMRYIWLVSK